MQEITLDGTWHLTVCYPEELKLGPKPANHRHIAEGLSRLSCYLVSSPRITERLCIC